MAKPTSCHCHAVVSQVYKSSKPVSDMAQGLFNSNECKLENLLEINIVPPQGVRVAQLGERWPLIRATRVPFPALSHVDEITFTKLFIAPFSMFGSGFKIQGSKVQALD